MAQNKKSSRAAGRVGIFYSRSKCGRISGTYLINLLIILLFGLVMLFSASYATGYYRHNDSYYFIRPQVQYALLGLILMWIVSCVNYQWIRKWTWTLYALCLVLLVMVLFMEPINGCRRWINVEHLPTLQPSEIAKFSLILCMAHLIDKYRTRLNTLCYGVIVPCIWIVPFWGLLALEPHYSAMILMACILATILLLGGTWKRWFALGGFVGGILGALFLLTRMNYVQRRLNNWLNPENIEYQTQQSLYSIGSGGLFGLGIGNSRQKHLWLPEATNDFIFSVLCEELGFIGALICIALFAALILQGIHIGLKAPDRFGMLLCVGITAQIAWQVLFNIAVVSNLVPNTGISLPFFSSGGTSLVMLLVEIGVLLSVSREGNRAALLREEQKAAAARKKQLSTVKTSDTKESFT